MAVLFLCLASFPDISYLVGVSGKFILLQNGHEIIQNTVSVHIFFLFTYFNHNQFLFGMDGFKRMNLFDIG